MSYTLKLGTTASLKFENAINESQALAQLRSACPQFTTGLLKEKGWRKLSDFEIDEIIDKNIYIETTAENGEHYIRDESRDEYYESEIKLIEQ
jgi:hypothetical protein